MKFSSCTFWLLQPDLLLGGHLAALQVDHHTPSPFLLLLAFWRDPGPNPQPRSALDLLDDRPVGAFDVGGYRCRWRAEDGLDLLQSHPLVNPLEVRQTEVRGWPRGVRRRRGVSATDPAEHEKQQHARASKH